jgi:hypothetical protein
MELKELICEDSLNYKLICVLLSNNRERLSALKRKIDIRLQSQGCKSLNITEAIEKIYFSSK